MYTVILIKNSNSNTFNYELCNDGNYFQTNYIGGKNGEYIYWQLNLIHTPNGTLYYPGHSGDLNIKTFKDTITCINFNENINTSLIPTENIGSPYRHAFIRAPFQKTFSSWSPVVGYAMSLEEIECLLKSLPDWYGDSSSHEILLRIRYSIQENEESNQRLQQLFQMANNKGWTVYEEYT